MINQIKTLILLGVLTAILLLIGSFFGTAGLTIAFIFALLMNIGSYFFSHNIVLAMYRAKEAQKSHYKPLHDLVDKIAKEANIPKPRVFIIPSKTANAFATGRNPKNAVVAVTEGILSLLSQQELEGVLAHEIAHIKNRDILISTIAATIASVISYATHLAYFIPLGQRDEEGSSNALQMLLMVIIAPLAAVIIQLAISRTREFLADRSGAGFMKEGKHLASALRKLENCNKHTPLNFGQKTTASLFIVNPFSGRSFINLFSTHPPIETRIKLLEAMKF